MEPRVDGSGPVPPGSSGEGLSSVVCTDIKTSVNWQIQVLIQAWRSVGQPGEFVRLVAMPDGGAVPDHVDARVVTTRAPNTHPDTGDF